MQKIYNLSAVEKFVNLYIEKGGEMITIIEGSLGYGTALLTGADGLRHSIIKEIFLNEWSSGHTVRQYKKIPKKYLKILDNL